MIPNLVGLGAMVLVARSSDRRVERRYHAALPLCAAAAALFFLSSGPSLIASVALWCLVCAGIYKPFRRVQVRSHRAVAVCDADSVVAPRGHGVTAARTQCRSCHLSKS
jgi:hypothetical protein